MSIIVDQEFKNLIPPLTPEEFAQLEENCVKGGIRDALIVWGQEDGNSILIDGHNRWAIVGKHPTLHFNIRRMEFADRDAAKLWIIDNQLGQRNLIPYDKTVLELKKKDILSKQAREISHSNLKRGASEGQTFAPRGKVNDQIGKRVGLSRETVRKVEAIQNSGDQQLIKDIREGRETIHSGYQKVHPKKTPVQSMKETLEEAKQEHEDFKSNKTVSIYEAQMDKANRHIIAIDLYNRLLTMGKRINDVAVDMEEGSINIGEMCKALDQSKVKELKTSIRIMYEQLMRIDKELKIG